MAGSIKVCGREKSIVAKETGLWRGHGVLKNLEGKIGHFRECDQSLL